MENKLYQNDINRSNNLFEVKYKVPFGKVNLLNSKLSHYTFIPLNFADAKLETIYFDDEKNSSFDESINGNLLKRKYRFRKYINPQVGGAFYSLEIKSRKNTKTSKLKKLIFNELPSNYEFRTFRKLLSLIEKETNLDLKDFYNSLPDKTLFPSTCIKYERKRFDSYEGNVRYNLDTNIEVKLASRNSFQEEQTISLGYAIFEIKSMEPEFFPFFLKELNLTPNSFSKFSWGKDILNKMTY